MKRLFALAGLLVGLCASGQGVVNFSTFDFAPVTNGVTGQLIATGDAWWAQLFYGTPGTEESQLVAFTNPPVRFLIPGYILNSVRYYTDRAILDGGAFGLFQVRVWAAVLGTTWQAAYANWLSSPASPDRLLGKSNIALIRTGDALIIPPSSPPSLRGDHPPWEIGMRGFAVEPVPEPGASWLVLLGALAWVFRRRQSPEPAMPGVTETTGERTRWCLGGRGRTV